MFGRVVLAVVVVACLLAMPFGNASAVGTSGWSVQWLPVPSSALTVPLSCSSSTACTAVATDYPYPSSDSDVLYAVRWNGRRWSRAVMAEPVGSITVLVGGISCPSASSCVAVGGFTSGDSPSRYAPLVERWNGTVWSLERVPAPAGVRLSSRLTGVSCTSPTACTAVGESASPAGTTSLVERWNGTTWSIERATGGSLLSVSCTSRLACTAVGHAGNETLGEGWNGSRWSIQPNPHPRGFGGPRGANELGSVSCASSDACIGVGDSSWGSGFNSVRITLAEDWNGSEWSVQPTPIESSSTSSTASPARPLERASRSATTRIEPETRHCRSLNDGTVAAGRSSQRHPVCPLGRRLTHSPRGGLFRQRRLPRDRRCGRRPVLRSGLKH